MSFKIKDNELLEMYNKMWDRVSNIKKRISYPTGIWKQTTEN